MTDTGPEASRNPTLAELIRAAMDARGLEVHNSLPCRVDKFNPATQTADLKPLIRRRFQNPDGTEIDESIAVIPRVPVAWPRAGKFFITWPLKKGDLVEVIITDASRDNFQSGDGAEVDPDDFRRFDLSDAWATPAAGYPDKRAIKNFDPDDLVIGVDGGVVIHVKESGEIHLGSKNAADALALASQVKAENQTLFDAISNAVIVATDGGASLKATILAALTTATYPNDVGSDVVKSD
jgi:hypothetical protein